MKGGQRAAKVAERARWIIGRQRERPSLTFLDKVAELRKKFGCGKTAAEQAIQLAGQILRDQFSADKNPGLYGEIADFYKSLAEDARALGDIRGARSAMDSLRRHTGIGAPDRVEHTGGLKIDLGELSDAELAVLAKLDIPLAPAAAPVVAIPEEGDEGDGDAADDEADPDVDAPDDGDGGGRARRAAGGAKADA